MLARAIRAALLMQHSTNAAGDFTDWRSAEQPHVRVTFEVQSGRIWRVEKRFGTPGMSILEESKDGLTFSPLKKAREVDDELRTQLGWGIAGPATKGAPRGLPTSFLATALLGEQADVAKILTQTLSEDTDESGRARLTRALAAFAQHPLFKTILDHAQARVDAAFTATGMKKRGKASPFRDIADELKRARDYIEQVKRRLDDSESVRALLKTRNEELLGRREDLTSAEQQLATLRERLAAAEAHATIVDERSALENKQRAERAQLDALEDREREHAELVRQELEVAQSREALVDGRDSRHRRVLAAEEAVRRAQSDDAERQRELRRAELQTRAGALALTRRDLDGRSLRAVKALQASKRLQDAETEHKDLTAKREELNKQLKVAQDALEAATRKVDVADVATRVVEQRRLMTTIIDVQALKQRVQDDRQRVVSFRDAAATARARKGQPLPTPEVAGQLRSLRHEFELAEARLGGGLTVTITKQEAVHVTAAVDGTPAPVEQTEVSFDAQRAFSLQVGDYATIEVTAGERDARARSDELRRRWTTEAIPVLALAGVADLSQLARREAEHQLIVREIESAEREAETLEAFALQHEVKIATLGDLQRDLASLGTGLQQEPLAADASQLVDSLGGRSLDSVRTEHRVKQANAKPITESLSEQLRSTPVEIGKLEGQMESERRLLAELGTSPAAGWDDEALQVATDLARLAEEEHGLGAQVALLSAERDATVKGAEEELQAAKTELAETDAAIATWSTEIERLRVAAAALDGEIRNRRESAQNVDIAKTQRALDELNQRLAALPELVPVMSDAIRDAELALERAKADFEREKDEVNKAEGGLQTVGGQMVHEEHDAAKESLRLAERRERELETDSDAWKLLVEKLREAENTEGQHLGEALSVPVSKRFGELTAGRYGKLAVAANLQAEGLVVAGAVRALSALSLGTQEQLATLLRLTIAEHLDSLVLLDDHLSQTDPVRSAWFLDVLRAHAAHRQVIVLTCRPRDYLGDSDMPTNGDATSIRAGGLLTAIDLGRLITRST